MMDKNKIVLIIIADLLVVFFTGWLFVLPKYNEVNALNAKVKEKEEELEGKIQTVEAQELVRESYAQIEEEDISKVIRVLPKTDNSTDLLAELETLLNQKGLNINTLAINNPYSGTKQQSPTKRIALFVKGEIKAQEIAMSVGGSYEAFKDFLRGIENDERLMDVSDVSFKGDKAASESTGPENRGNNFIYSITLYTYWLN